MSGELVAMLGGGVTGFVMKLISAQMNIQANAIDAMIKKQGVSDDSADRAAKRTGEGGAWIRRFIAICILFSVVFAPFVMAFFDIPVTVEANKLVLKFLGIGADKWKNLEGFVLLPEVRQGMLALLGFYFGSSQVK
jgi:plasmid maintenance system antidote protein VapI